MEFGGGPTKACTGIKQNARFDMFAKIYDATALVSRRMVQLNGLVLLFTAFLVAGDVICRKLLNITLAGSDEISGYVLAISSAWAYSYCLIHRSHVRIDVIYTLFPVGMRGWFDVLGLLSLLTFISILSYRALGVLLESLARGSVSNTSLQTPLWLPQLLWVAGLMFFTFTLIVLSVRAILAMLEGDNELVAEIAGIPTINEEIESETHNIVTDQRT